MKVKRNKIGRKTVFPAVILVLLLTVLLGAWFILRPDTVAGAKNLTVNVHHLSGETKTFSVKTDAEFLRAALEAETIISGTESTYGLWVETVDGETADADLQQWWGYDVNGETAVYGVDQQPVADGDVIDFKLNVGY